jgi:hypothetical protein
MLRADRKEFERFIASVIRSPDFGRLAVAV